MKKWMFTLFVCALGGSMFVACKKQSTSQNCTLVALTDSTTSLQAATQFTYDAGGRLSSAIVTGQKGCTRTYQYVGDFVIFTVKDTTPGVLAEIDTIVLNSRGLIK